MGNGNDLWGEIRLNTFWQLSFNSLTLKHKRFPILQQWLPLLEQVWKSKPARAQVSEQTLDKHTGWVQDEDMAMNEGRGKSCWMGDKQYSCNYFLPRSARGSTKPLETWLMFPASFALARNGSQMQRHAINENICKKIGRYQRANYYFLYHYNKVC